jgi:signal transduction histidine kinase
VLPPEVASQYRGNDLQVLGEKRSFQFEEQVLQDDGPHTYLSVKFPIYTDAGEANGVCSISTDVTAVKKAHQQLRRLSRSIMTRQENERSAVARELHDELGQMLTALRMDAVWLRRRLEKVDAPGAGRAAAMCRLIDTSIENVRGMAIRLRPGVLDTLGLVDALEWFSADFERRTEISCTFEHNGVSPVGGDLATAAYRIAQEALTNVARHADATHVHVNLAAADASITLSVADDGRGFDTRVLEESEALGVAGMRERATLVGGELLVQSRQGEGTQVVFRAPLKQPEA